MINDVNMSAMKALNDSVLIDETKKLLGLERNVLGAFLVYLAELDVRKIYAISGYPSLFKYLVKEFNLSEASAAKRVGVASASLRIITT